ncbi:MAG: PEP/pyruvate-binding domain-containing protein, partial [Geminicoccaceae bacterium]
MLAVALSTPLATELSLVGGKAASLIRLAQAGFAVPDGYVLTSAFFLPWINELRSSSEWRLVRDKLGSTDSSSLREACVSAKRLVDDLPFTRKQRAQLEDVQAGMQAGMGDQPTAVRSSSPEEDLSGTSFAGLYETVLNVTRDRLEQAVRSCFASCLDERVLLYKREHDLSVEAPTIAVIVQAQLASDISGVGFSLNPLTNDFDETLINASWGQGQALVSGDINPDRFVINKVSGEIVERLTGSKGGDRPDEVCLSDEQLSKLSEMLKAIEDLY